MIQVSQIKVNDTSALGLRVELPQSPPLVLLIGGRGFVMCGFLDVDVAERIDVAAAMVSGVRTVEDVLGAEVKAATGRAMEAGVKVGMTGREAIELLL